MNICTLLNCEHNAMNSSTPPFNDPHTVHTAATTAYYFKYNHHTVNSHHPPSTQSPSPITAARQTSPPASQSPRSPR